MMFKKVYGLGICAFMVPSRGATSGLSGLSLEGLEKEGRIAPNSPQTVKFISIDDEKKTRRRGIDGTDG